MAEAFEAIATTLFGPRESTATLPIVDATPWLVPDELPGASELTAVQSAVMHLNAAFLVALGGADHPAADRAQALFDEPPPDAPMGLSGFYRRAIDVVRDEVATATRDDSELASQLEVTAERLAAIEPGADAWQVATSLWSAFFPEGLGILGREAAAEADLRARRTVTITSLAESPITDPARQVLFTSNVLLTLPAATTPIDALPYDAELKAAIGRATGELQQHWYDHPIQIGVEPAANELLYGLRALDDAVGFELERARAASSHGPRGGSEPDRRVTCVLSVSVTHAGLQAIARPYIEAELIAAGGLRHLDVFVVTEADCRRLVEEVLAPAAATIGPKPGDGDAGSMLAEVFGVDGAYGRHYSFLKAVSALWSVLIDTDIRATFKIDLDQVFDQPVLVVETGASAFEHLATPRWGARGTDSAGRPIELGLLAGALVNERDIGRGLFTPDVDYPAAPPTPEQHLFMSGLPQALSTRAEMMTRYDDLALDGSTHCLERIHVTGGTNGILVDALRRHRPFTPSFVGRAEDQAYVLSTLGRSGSRLGHVHEPGLIMRHDKEAFAGEAIAAAEAGRLVGDDVRILYFSAYGRHVAGHGPDGPADMATVKALLDPFTGCFISRLPRTIALLRFATRIAHAFERERAGLAMELAASGWSRLEAALGFTGDDGGFGEAVERERQAWAVYYDALDALEASLGADDRATAALQARALEIMAATRVAGRVD